MIRLAYTAVALLLLNSCSQTSGGSANSSSGHMVWLARGPNTPEALAAARAAFNRDNFDCTMIARSAAPVQSGVGHTVTGAFFDGVVKAVDAGAQQQDVYNQCMLSRDYIPKIQ